MTWDLPLFRILGTLPGLGGRTADSPALVLSLAPLVMLLAWAAVLDWRPARPSLDEMIGSAWAWRQAHPSGYAD